MKKILFILSPIFFICTALTAQRASDSVTRLSLQDCIKTGIANNQDVVQSGLIAQTQRIYRNGARLNMLPDLNANANSGINNGRSIDPYTNAYSNQEIKYSGYGVSSRVVLFNGLYLQRTAQQNQLLFEADKMDFKNEKEKLAVSIILNYLQVLSGQDLLQQTIQQAGLSQKQVERLDLMNREGAISPYLLYDLRGQYASDQIGIINARNALETSKLSLCQLMNIPYDHQIELESIDTAVVATNNSPDRKPADIYTSALESLALVRAADLHVMSNEKALKASRGKLFPELSFNGNANTNYSSAAYRSIVLGTSDVPSQDYVLINNVASQLIRKEQNTISQKIKYGDQLKNNIFSSFSLNMTIPIFNGAFNRNNTRIADINLQNSKVIAKTTKNRLQLAIEQAYVDLNSASEKFKTLQEQVSAFDESFHSAEIRFNEGVITSVDYLAAKNNLDRSNINFIAAKYELVLRRKVLDYYEGRPLY